MSSLASKVRWPFGPSQVALWAQAGGPLKPFRWPSGPSQVALWSQSGGPLCPVRWPFGPSQVVLWAQSGGSLGPFRWPFCDQLGLFSFVILYTLWVSNYKYETTHPQYSFFKSLYPEDL